MYTFVSEVNFAPAEAGTFFKVIRQSDKYPNDTFAFEIEESSPEEKTGNISVFVSVVGFNQNYSHYLSLP